MAEKFIRERVRFRVGDGRILVIQGWIDKEAPGPKNIGQTAAITESTGFYTFHGIGNGHRR